ncbi:apolipoprotein N-acyltransferase [Roseicitreum antarcticum]|uniref:Apolipoprotein N-acyltransferase n=1 Tax=Roseicitreum antarcticum TaxID=564137 RepID=A0A1H2UGY3_9RHOB|nr:apolipoprotein N-acyltransferase [Roseicitreum antarcticum]SDW55168.1 apolipoprotein N-acyltransferase [Roseicitreum antarcticum]
MTRRHPPTQPGRVRLARFGAGVAAPAGVGALIALGQAPLGWWWVSLAALSMLFHCAVQSRGPRATALLFWAAGTGYFLAALFWLVEPFLIAPERHAWMAPFALLMMAGGLALFWALAGWLGAWLTRWPGPAGLPRLLALAFSFVAAEWARGYVFTGFPWALLGHIWTDTPVAQLAAITGPLGLSLLTVLPVALLVWAVTGSAPSRGASSAGMGQTSVRVLSAPSRDAVSSKANAGPLRAAALVIAVSAVAGAWLWGQARLAQPMPAPAQSVQLRLVQPNAPQAEKWRYDLAEMFFYRHLYLSAAPPRADTPPPDLVIWSETAVPFLLDTMGVGLQMSADAAAPARLALGVQRSDEEGRFFNSLAVLGADGQPTHVYDKHHLVPFGEYVPFADALLGANYAGFAARQLQGYSPGPGPQLLDLGALDNDGPGQGGQEPKNLGRVLPLICYEAVFPRHLRTEVRPDWVLQVTNDAWFGALTGPYQHLAQARLRAVEQGLPLVRVANTGVSAIIDARGQVLAALPLNTLGALDGAVPGALPPTPYARFGDLPIGVLLVAGLTLLALRRRNMAAAH